MLLIVSLNNYTQNYYSSYPKMCLVELTFLTNVCWINWIVTGSFFWWYLHSVSSLEHCVFFFLTIIFSYLINLFWMFHVTCGILVPWPGIEPVPPVLGAQSLKTTGPPGKSQSTDFWALGWNHRWLPSSLLDSGLVWAVLSLWNPDPDLPPSLPDHGAGPTPSFPKGQVVASYSPCPS